jgi:co-chaperonin GroES (HSP10)
MKLRPLQDRILIRRVDPETKQPAASLSPMRHRRSR